MVALFLIILGRTYQSHDFFHDNPPGSTTGNLSVRSVQDTGAGVGLLDGVGADVGDATGLVGLGERVGVAVGEAVGVAVGAAVGADTRVGGAVGVAVGAAVGAEVGVAVHLEVGTGATVENATLANPGDEEVSMEITVMVRGDPA